MKDNEKNFDIIKEHVDAWSFYTSDVSHGESPVLLASKEQNTGYMSKRQTKYLFDMYEKGIADNYRQSAGVLALDEKVRLKIKDLKEGNGR